MTSVALDHSQKSFTSSKLISCAAGLTVLRHRHPVTCTELPHVFAPARRFGDDAKGERMVGTR